MEKSYSPTLKILSELRSPERKKLREDKTVTITLNDVLNRSKAAERANNTVSEKKESISSTEKRALISTSNVAAKESVTLRKNIEKVVKRVKVLEGIVKEITKTFKSVTDPKKQLLRIRNIITAQGDAYKLKEAELEETSVLQSLDESSKASYKVVKGVALLTALIPLLISPEVREELLGFFKGLISSLGLSKTQLSILGGVLGAATGLLGMYFSYKAFDSVVNAFEKMKQLANLLGIAGQAVDAKDKATKAEASDLRRKRLKMVKRLKTLKNVKNFISNISRFLKGIGIGFAVGMAIDVIGGTVIDIATADPDVEINPVNVLKIAYNNLIDSVPFLGRIVKKLELDKEDTSQSSGESYGQSQGTRSMSEVKPPMAATASEPKPAAPAPSQPEAEPAGQYSTPEEVNISKAVIPQSSEGTNIEASSRELVQKENDLVTTKNSSIVIVDNTQSVYVSPEESSPFPGSTYSVGVGY